MNISEWTPRSLASPSASSAANVEGTAPIPVWIVDPSPMNSAACLAIATSTSVGSRLWQLQRLGIALDQDVDLVDVKPVRVLRRQAGGPGNPLAASTISTRRDQRRLS